MTCCTPVPSAFMTQMSSVVDDRTAVGRPARMLNYALPWCQPAYVGTVCGCDVDGLGVVRIPVSDEHDLRSIR